MRTAEAADAPPIARLVNAAFVSERFFIDGNRTDPEKVAALLQKGKFLLLFENGELVGSIYTEIRGERSYLGLLAVDPGRQRAGIGARLIAAAEGLCRSAGCRFMDLTFVNVRKDCRVTTSVLGMSRAVQRPFEQIKWPKCRCILSECLNLFEFMREKKGAPKRAMGGTSLPNSISVQSPPTAWSSAKYPRSTQFLACVV
jgi:GNAT superfamily N-acetyltransferase